MVCTEEASRGDGTAVKRECLVDPNKIAGTIIKTTKGANINKQFNKEVKYGV